MKVTVYNTTSITPSVASVTSFSDIQLIVGGYVESHKPPNSKTTLLFNEDGRSLNLPQNVRFPELLGNVIVAEDGWQKLP